LCFKFSWVWLIRHLFHIDLPGCVHNPSRPNLYQWCKWLAGTASTSTRVAVLPWRRCIMSHGGASLTLLRRVSVLKNEINLVKFVFRQCLEWNRHEHWWTWTCDLCRSSLQSHTKDGAACHCWLVCQMGQWQIVFAQTYTMLVQYRAIY